MCFFGEHCGERLCQCDKFTQEFIDQPKRSENKTTRNKLLTFASQGKSYRLKSDNKVALVQMVWDLFGTMIFCHCNTKLA